jgi:hypothetical protein
MRKAPLSAVPLLLVLLLSATGCTRYYWSKPGATAEQFTQDNQACLGQAAGALPAGAALEAVEQYYRACLGSRGYVRDKQVEPPPSGSYRGIERGEEFDAAVQAAGQTPRQGFEQQLAQLDDLKARGRITEDEYATMRKRLVDGVTPGALTAAPPAPPAPAAPATPPRTLAGRWYGTDRSVLDIRGDGRRLERDWEHERDRATMRPSVPRTVCDKEVALVGRGTGSLAGGYPQNVAFSLTWDGTRTLRGTFSNPSNLPRGVTFTRDRR